MGKGKTLVAYYSHSGNTRRLAKAVQEATGGDLVELAPAEPYPADYDTVVAQAKREIAKGFRPALAKPVDASGYDAVIVGTPNWWSTMAPPVATFLESADLSGKAVSVFCTHGGGGSGRIERDAAKLCPDADRLPGFSTYGRTFTKSQVEKWLAGIGLASSR